MRVGLHVRRSRVTQRQWDGHIAWRTRWITSAGQTVPNECVVHLAAAVTKGAMRVRGGDTKSRVGADGRVLEKLHVGHSDRRRLAEDDRMMVETGVNDINDVLTCLPIGAISSGSRPGCART